MVQTSRRSCTIRLILEPGDSLRAIHARARHGGPTVRSAAGTGAGGPLRPGHPHARRGGRARLRGGRHTAGRCDPVHGGAVRSSSGPHAPHALRGELGGSTARRPRHRVARAHGASRRGEGGDRTARRPARALRHRGRGAAGRTSGRHSAHARGPRQRDQFERRRHGRGLSPARGNRRRRCRPDSVRVAGPHRPHGEPRRAEPLRIPERDRAGPVAGRSRRVRRTRRALAGRAREPLPVRPQPGPLHAEPARDAREGGRVSRIPAPDRGGSARDGRGCHLLLPAHRAALQPVVRGGTDRAHGRVRRGDRGAVRLARLRVLQPGRLRPLLSRLRRHVADGTRRARHDVRAGERPRAQAEAVGRGPAHLRRRGAAPLHGRTGDGPHGSASPRGDPARLSRVPA